MIIQQFYTSIENQYNSNITEIHGDNGSEFGGRTFELFIASKGYKFTPTTPNHHHQNGIAECSHGVITQKARAMIIGAYLPRSLWPEVVQATIYVTNCTLIVVNPLSAQALPRLQEAMGFPVNSRIQHLRAYGTTKFVHIPPETRPARDKFNARAQKGFLVGYADGINYRIWISAKNVLL